jgi:DNA-binding NarL/FixJ family response regulator
LVSFVKFLIVDGYTVGPGGLGAALAEICPDAAILHARDVAEGLNLAQAHADLSAVILASPAGDADSIEAFGSLALRPPIIVLSDVETASHAREALTRGARGYVPQSAGPRTLLSAIRLALDGDLYIPPLILEDTTPAPTGGEAKTTRPSLTARQIEVLRRLSAGQSNRTIAEDLGVSMKTVKAHATAIFKALNVANRAEAAVAGRRARLI